MSRKRQYGIHDALQATGACWYAGTTDREAVFGEKPAAFPDEATASKRAEGLRKQGYEVAVLPLYAAEVR